MSAHHQVGLPLQSSTSSIPSVIYQSPYGAQPQMQMVAAAGSVTSQSGGGYTLPPTAAYFPMAAYTTIQQQHQQPPSSQPPTSLQQPVNVQSSQPQLQTTASTASAIPTNAASNVVDTATSSVSKSIDGTPLS